MRKQNTPYLQIETALQRGFDLRIMQLLLAGVLRVLGRCLSFVEKAEYRDRAFRIRAAMKAVNLYHETRDNNESVLMRWSGETQPHWWDRMRQLAIRISRRITPFAIALAMRAAAGLRLAIQGLPANRLVKPPP